MLGFFTRIGSLGKLKCAEIEGQGIQNFLALRMGTPRRQHFFPNFGRAAHTDFCISLETFKAALETLDTPKSEIGVIFEFITKVGSQRVLISMYYI